MTFADAGSAGPVCQSAGLDPVPDIGQPWRNPDRTPPMLSLLHVFPPEILIAFTLGGLALNFAPGIDVFFATASGLQGGPKAGAMAGLGV
ncbi:MAG: hypothetical protein WAU13_09120, partial [Albidovulum sp.]